jgi:hypothetical protein
LPAGISATKPFTLNSHEVGRTFAYIRMCFVPPVSIPGTDSQFLLRAEIYLLQRDQAIPSREGSERTCY